MQSQSEQPMSFQQRIQLARALAYFLALLVIPIWRRKVGLRVVKPTYLFVLTTLLVVAASIARHNIGNVQANILIAYAFINGGAGLIQHYMRWIELNRGKFWNTYCTGISPLEHLPLPNFLLTHHRIPRFVDPLLLLAAAFLISPFAPPLALVVGVGAMGMRISEQYFYDASVERALDAADGESAARATAANVAYIRQAGQGAKPSKPLSLEDTAGVPTGVSPELERHVVTRERREAEEEKRRSSIVVPAPGELYETIQREEESKRLLQSNGRRR